MLTRETRFAICVKNRGAEDLDVRKVYRVLPDKDAAATSYVRVMTSPVRITSILLITSCSWSCR